MRRTLSFFLLAAMVLAFTGIQNAAAQTQAPPQAPTATPDIVATLQSVVSTQEAQNRTLTHNVEDLTRAEQDWQWKWGIAGAIVGALGAILASLGISNLTDFKKKLADVEKDFSKQIKQIDQKWENNLQERESEWNAKSQRALNKMLHKFDLSNLPIYVPKELGALRLRLEYSGLQPLDYTNLERVPLNGVIVVRVDTEADEQAFRAFIEKYKPHPQKTAFLLYAATLKISAPTLACFDNLVTSNFPSAAVGHILAVGRGLQIEATEKEGL